MEKTKKILNRIFIDGLSGMALGLFSTLIIGTIIAQIGTLIGGPVGSYLKAISNVAKTLTGAGIGVGTLDLSCGCWSAAGWRVCGVYEEVLSPA